MELAADEEGVLGLAVAGERGGAGGVCGLWELHDLHDGLGGVATGEDEPALFEAFDVLGVDFVAVAEAFADGEAVVVEEVGEGVFFDEDVLSAEAHGAAEAFDFLLVGEFADDGVSAAWVELAGGGVVDSQDVSGELDDGDLEAQADAEVGDEVFAAVFDAGDFAFDAAGAETARHDDGVHVGESLRGELFGDFGGVDPVEVDVGLEVGAAVLDGFVDGGVGVAEVGVFAGDADGDVALFFAGELADETGPEFAGAVFVSGVDAVVEVDQREDLAVEFVGAHLVGDGVDALAVVEAEGAFQRDVAEHRDLLKDGGGTGLGGAAGDDVGLDPRFHQAFEPELGGLGLLFAQDARLDDVGEGDEAGGVFTFFEGEFAEGFDVEGVFVVADGAADFDEDDVGGAGAVARDGELANLAFHFTGDVGDHLHVTTEVMALAFAFEDLGVEAAAGGEVFAGEVLVEHALVGAQVHVAFGAVVEDEDFAVAIGVEGAGVDVEVALELDGGDGEAFVFEEFAEGGGEDAFAQA